MAERKYFAIVTDVGQTKIAEAAAGGKKLNVTTFIAGDGNGEYYIPTSDMTAIKKEVWRGTISEADVVQDAQKILRVTTIIPAKVNGFIVRELGLLDETGELIAIGNSPDLPKVSLENGFSIDMQLTMRLAVKNAETFSFEIDPNTVILTKDMLDTHNVDGNAHEELFEEKADKQHQHSTDDIISGTLPIERGGTGADTPSNALSNLGGFSNKGGNIDGDVYIGGSVEINNTSDVFNVSTTSGRISLSTTSGAISLSTTSGAISLSTTSGTINISSNNKIRLGSSITDVIELISENVEIPNLNLATITSNT